MKKITIISLLKKSFLLIRFYLTLFCKKNKRCQVNSKSLILNILTEHFINRWFNFIESNSN